MADNSLFPAPINLVNISNEELQKIYDVYRLAGMMIAKSISDDRLIDLPISPLFWDLVLGKVRNQIIFIILNIRKLIFSTLSDWIQISLKSSPTFSFLQTRNEILTSSLG